MQRAHLLAAAALFVSLAAAGTVGPFHQASPPVEHVTDDRLVAPADDGSVVWPYTSRIRSVTGRTLALNVVVVGEPSAVRRALTGRTPRDWEPTAGHARVDLSRDRPGWQFARGSARYTYRRAADEPGEWVRSAYQRQSGSYFGRRLHVRAYPAPGGEWTALQAHGEYWDWFRLRHTVTSVAAAGDAVERDFAAWPAVADVRRLRHGLDGGGSRGWLSVVEFGTAAAGATSDPSAPARTEPVPAASGTASAATEPPPPAVGVGPLAAVGLPVVAVGLLAAGRWRVPAAALRLPAGVAGVYLGVRLAGVGVESVVPAVPSKVVAAPCYLALVVGIPYAAVRFGRPLGSDSSGRSSTTAEGRSVARASAIAAAATLAVGGFLLGLGVDAALFDVARLPGPLLLHRVALAAALGALAAGAAGRDHRLLLVGAAGWLAGLAAPLAGVV